MSKNGLILLTPTSIAHTGTSATISANGSVSFSAVTQLRLNGVFSADYDNYMVVTWHLATANGYGWRARLSSGGTDNVTASSYTRQNLDADGSAVSGSRASSDFFVLGPADDTLRSGTIGHFYGPYLAQPTAFRSLGASGYSNAWLSDYAVTHNQSTAYDGFNLYTFTGSISGRIAVYGMRK